MLISGPALPAFAAIQESQTDGTPRDNGNNPVTPGISASSVRHVGNAVELSQNQRPPAAAVIKESKSEGYKKIYGIAAGASAVMAVAMIPVQAVFPPAVVISALLLGLSFVFYALYSMSDSSGSENASEYPYAIGTTNDQIDIAEVIQASDGQELPTANRLDIQAAPRNIQIYNSYGVIESQNFPASDLQGITL